VPDPPNSTMSADLKALVNNPKYSDVSFVVEGKKIHAHLGIFQHHQLFSLLAVLLHVRCPSLATIFESGNITFF
jgi:hypothetical protein